MYAILILTILCAEIIYITFSQDNYSIEALKVVMTYLTDSPVATLQQVLVECPDPYCSDVRVDCYMHYTHPVVCSRTFLSGTVVYAYFRSVLNSLKTPKAASIFVQKTSQQRNSKMLFHGKKHSRQCSHILEVRTGNYNRP